MRIIAISDYMGAKAYLEPLNKVIKEKEPEVLLFAGGITSGDEHIKEIEAARQEERKPDRTKEVLFQERKKKREDFETFFDFIAKVDTQCLIIPGRTDCPEGLYEAVLSDISNYQNIRHLHLKFAQIEGILFSGCGGLIADDNEEFFECRIDRDSVISKMENLRGFKQEKILLFHTPPTLNREKPPVPGSVYVDELIELLRPKMLFYGMVSPENGMKIIDDCVTIDPGPLSEGNYVMVNTTTMNVDFKKLELD